MDRLQAALETAGIPVWRDTSYLWPGEDWRARIRAAITKDALAFIACFSSAGWARRETGQNAELALSVEQLRLRRPDDPWLVPVRLDDCEMPEYEIGGGRTLSSLQRADLFGPDKRPALARLIEGIRRILGEPAEPIDPNLGPIVASGAQLSSIVSSLARNIDDDYRGRTPLLLSILPEAEHLTSDLVRELSIDFHQDQLRVETSSGGGGSGVIRVVQGLTGDLGNRPVLLLAGTTTTAASQFATRYVARMVAAQGASSVELCTLVSNAGGNGLDPRYIGIAVKPGIILGYGLVEDARYRHRPFLAYSEGYYDEAGHNDPTARERADGLFGGVTSSYASELAKLLRYLGYEVIDAYPTNPGVVYIRIGGELRIEDETVLKGSLSPDGLSLIVLEGPPGNITKLF